MNKSKPVKRSSTAAKRGANIDGERVLDARPDTLDFRDLVYTPPLVEVPPVRALADYRRAKVPVLDQGDGGACTGFGLATVVHYLLRHAKLRRIRRS